MTTNLKSVTSNDLDPNLPQSHTVTWGDSHLRHLTLEHNILYGRALHYSFKALLMTKRMKPYQLQVQVLQVFQLCPFQQVISPGHSTTLQNSCKRLFPDP